MSDFQDSDNQLEGFEEGPTIPPERPTGGGRGFAIAMTVIGILLLAGLCALGIVLLNRNPASSTDQAARINTQNTQIAAAATEQVRIAQLQQTVDAANLPTATIPPTAAPIVATALVAATNTSVVAIPTATNTPIPPTATVLPAEQTKNAAAKTSIALGTAPVGGGAGAGTPQATATGLPNTGFADQAGLPGMIGLAVLLLAVILVAKRLRSSPSQ